MSARPARRWFPLSKSRQLEWTPCTLSRASKKVEVTTPEWGAAADAAGSWAGSWEDPLPPALSSAARCSSLTLNRSLKALRTSACSLALRSLSSSLLRSASMCSDSALADTTAWSNESASSYTCLRSSSSLSRSLTKRSESESTLATDFALVRSSADLRSDEDSDDVVVVVIPISCSDSRTCVLPPEVFDNRCFTLRLITGSKWFWVIRI